MPIMWRKIHNVFAETPVEETLLFHNDDLVGFFNSIIPQERLIAMVEALLREFQTKHPAAFVMVDAHGSTKTFAVHLGFSKQSSHANFKRFLLEHLVALVQLSFQCGRFIAVGIHTDKFVERAWETKLAQSSLKLLLPLLK